MNLPDLPEGPEPAATEEAAPAPKGKKLHELVSPGKPLLISAVGANVGIVQQAKEVAWKLGLDPRVVTADPFVCDDVESAFRAASGPGVLIVVEDLHLAAPEERQKVRTLMKDPDQTVIVALPSKPLEELPPGEFGHWVKF